MPGNSTDILRVSSLTAETPVTIWLNAHEAISLSVRDVLRWIAPNAPEHEAFKFMLTCRAARVDPFLKEAHLISYNTKNQGTVWVTIIDKAGWLRRAEEHPAYDGNESGVIIFNPNDQSLHEVAGAYVPPNWGCIGGWARVHRKDRRVPTTAKVGSEYAKDTPNWKSMLPTMYRKTALIAALRESGLCFGFNGAYSRDEMPADVVAEVTSAPQAGGGGSLVGLPFVAEMPSEVKADYEATPLPNLYPNTALALHGVIQAVGMTDHQIAAMLARRGVSTLTELTEHQAKDIIMKLQDKLDQTNAGQILLPDRSESDVDPSAQIAVDFPHGLDASERAEYQDAVNRHDYEHAATLRDTAAKRQYRERLASTAAATVQEEQVQVSAHELPEDTPAAPWEAGETMKVFQDSLAALDVLPPEEDSPGEDEDHEPGQPTDEEMADVESVSGGEIPDVTRPERPTAPRKLRKSKKQSSSVAANS